MKRKVLSLLLTFCMALSLMPVQAFAAGENVAQVDSTNYPTLAKAIEAVTRATDKTITLLAADVEVGADDVIAKDVTLKIPTGTSLKITSSSAAKFLTGQGNVVVETGGAIKVPGKSSALEELVGGQNARFNLTKGSVKLDLNSKTITVTSSSTVNVPTGKDSFLMLDLGGRKTALNATVESGAAVTVNGKLVLASGTESKGSQVTVVDGATLTVAANGVMTVAKAAAVTGKITLAPDGKVLAVNDISTNIDGNKEALSDDALKDGSKTFALGWKGVAAPKKDLQVSVAPTANAINYGAKLNTSNITGTVKVQGEETEVTGTWAWATDDAEKILDAGDHSLQATFTPEHPELYNALDAQTVTVTVNKGTHDPITKAVEIPVNSTEPIAVDLTTDLAGIDGAKIKSVTPATNDLVASHSTDGLTVKITPNKADATNQTADLTVTVESTNYNDFTVTLNLKTVEAPKPETKDVTVTYVISGGTWDGKSDKANKTEIVTVTNGKGTMTKTPDVKDAKPDDTHQAPGQWMKDGKVVADMSKENIADNVTYTYTFAKKATTSATVTFYVENGYFLHPDNSTYPNVRRVSITLTNGQGTLSAATVDAMLRDMVPNYGYSYGNWYVAPNTQENAITQDVTYTFKFFPNYYPPYNPNVPNVPGSNGTVVNPDGSTTTTVTRPDGTRVETTLAPNGTKTEVVRQTNGTVMTTETRRDGTQVNTTTDTYGNTTSNVYVPYNVGETVVTVPTQKPVSGGTVAVIVNANGTETLVKDSVITGSGVALPVAGRATVKIRDNTKFFADVQSAGHWAADAVEFVTAREIFNGTGAGKFEPNAGMTRGMLAVALHNLENNPQGYYSNSFGDVASDAWYAEAVQWAASQGIVSGFGDGKFAPGEMITREQLAVMLYRYAKDPQVSYTYLSFNDAGQVGGYAEEAVRWAVANGILTGKPGNLLDPQGNATRAEVAAMLQRFLSATVK